MKALYLALGRNLGAADAGTTHTLNIAKALGGLGVDITVAAQGVKSAGESGLKVLDWRPHGRLAQMAARPPEALLDAARKADIIQERAEESGGIGARLARIAGKPLVLEINTPLSGHRNPFLRRLADFNLARQARDARAIITQTPLSRAIIERYVRTPVFVAPNGADPDRFTPEAPAARVPAAEGRRVVAFAGSLRPWHGVEDLIAAFGRLTKSVPGVFLLVVGSGPREGELRRAAEKSLGADGGLFTGAVAPADVPSYLALAEVLAAPFAPMRDAVRRKQFARYGMWWSPVKIFEYMAMGKPIAASAAGMIPEYLGGGGVTHTPGDATALAEALEELLTRPHPAAALGQAARERLLEHYTWQKAAEKTLAVWQAILRGRVTVSIAR